MGRLLIQFPGTTTAKALTETLSKNVIIVDEDLHQLRLHDGSTAGGHLIGGSSGSGVPVGTIIPFAGNSIPQGYLLCDGSAISRTTYASLFAVIGTIYGAGDGNSTFNLPQTYVRSLVSKGGSYPVGTMSSGELPDIQGSFTFATENNGGYLHPEIPTGAFSYPSSTGNVSKLTSPGSFQGKNSLIFKASSSNSLYGSYGGVLPRCLVVTMCIKY